MRCAMVGSEASGVMEMDSTYTKASRRTDDDGDKERSDRNLIDKKEETIFFGVYVYFQGAGQQWWRQAFVLGVNDTGAVVFFCGNKW